MLERRTHSVPVEQERRGAGRDRRASQRYTATGTFALFTWQKGEGYDAIEVSLRDISSGGVSAIAEAAPPEDRPLWFRLRADDVSAWIGVTIVAISRTGFLGRGPRIVRTRFHETCPYEVFKAAISGLVRECADAEFARGGLRGRDGFR